MTEQILTSLHNHTTWSDGRASIAEMLAAATVAGVTELGISDHFLLPADGRCPSWSMARERLPEYVAAVGELAAASNCGVTLRLGVEADYLPEIAVALRDELARYPFDYVIGSVHLLDGFVVDYGTREWEALTPEEIDGKWREYWRRIRALAESRIYDFVGHLDVPKKFGHRPRADLRDDAARGLDAIAAADMAIEINTAGWSMPVAEAYPSLALLTEARARGIPVLINADAHAPEHLTRDFGRARELARQAGYTELVRYAQRRRLPAPL